MSEFKGKVEKTPMAFLYVGDDFSKTDIERVV